MIVSQKHKAGVTLMEVMAVVAIMGILSGLGVAGLRSAVANARIKDAAYNVTAFMERTANEARRMNTTLCVVKEDAQTLATYKGPCSEANGTGKSGLTKVDELILESPNKILDDGEVTASATLGGVNLVTNGAEFTPRQGLSAAPFRGFIAVQYGGDGRYGAAAKVSTKNAFVPMLKYDDGSWSKL
ncbi:MAG: prepilin-type N-terminal cleavage/methylation domain-containing protein [Fibrobacter sp.]|nr:prepilin-type N-terminal cleavage/methylation domain-containing protein [Fibrobacter sp.]